MLTFRDGKRWRPLVPQDVQTDRPVGIDIWVVDLRGEANLGRFERVVCRERDGEKEDTARIWRLPLYAFKKIDRRRSVSKRGTSTKGRGNRMGNEYI